MRYKTTVAKNLENVKITLDSTKRMLTNRAIQSEDVIKNLERVLSAIENSIDLIGREQETR